MIDKKINYKIIDNFISNKELFNMQSLFLDPDITSPIPWYYNAGTTGDYELKIQYDVEDYYFCNLFYVDDKPYSKGFKELKTILDKLNILNVAMNGEVTEDVPASILQNHKNVKVFYCD